MVHLKCGVSDTGLSAPSKGEAALPKWLSREKGAASHRGANVFQRPDSTHVPPTVDDWQAPILFGPPWLGFSFST
eukprot:scaffold97154_cov32-Tisochrysis_lutea.AAC.2